MTPTPASGTTAPWNSSTAIRTLEAERLRALKYPPLLPSFRDEVERKILPVLDRLDWLGLDRLAQDLVRAYLLVDGRETPLSLKALKDLPCLSEPNSHVKFCRRAVWFALDGWAPATFSLSDGAAAVLPTGPRVRLEEATR